MSARAKATNETRVSSVLNEVVARVGLPFGLSIAERAQRCADELLDVGDDEAIRYMLVEGWERELSRHFSTVKRSTRRATRALAAGRRLGAADNGFLRQQLAFPVIVPGRPPVPLAMATHELIAAALDAEERQVAGRQLNVQALRRLSRMTAKWPEEPVSRLIGRGAISPEELAKAIGG